MAGRHCIHCGATLTGSRFCINCGAMADDAAPQVHDGHTLTEAHLPATHGTKRALWLGVVALAIVALVTTLWLIRPSPDDVGLASADPSPQASTSPSDQADASADDTPASQETQSPTPALEPSGLPTRGLLTALTPQAVSATCEGQPGFDSRKFLVTLDAQSLVDGKSDTTWRCTYREDFNGQRWDPSKNRALGESVTFSFDRPVEIVGARFIPGYTKIDPYDGTNRYAQNGRPVLVEWRFGDGGVVRQEVRPKSPGSQPRCKVVGAACVLGEGWWSDEARNPTPSIPIEYVTLTILQIEPGNDSQLANSAAISEVEILGYS